jgi:membrane protein YqaA with SNARE-associated domain
MESFVELGLLGLFIASFLAATILPMNSEIVLSVLLVNNYSLSASLFVATLGNWLGGITNYGLGYLGKWELLDRFWGFKREKIEQMKIKIVQFGSFLAFFCWIPVIGDLFAVGLGFLKFLFLELVFGCWLERQLDM